LIALDRQERGTGELSAVQEVEQSLGVKVCSIIQLADLIEWLQKAGNHTETLDSVKQYRKTYGI
jgi:orotate phosphoribosyltransferase